MNRRQPLVHCYVGLGSNLGDPVNQIETALAELNALPTTTCARVSSLYFSQPMGPADQPNYVNAVAKLTTCFSAHQLLAKMLNIETAHGRCRATRPAIKNGPRTLDLDLLLHGEQILNDVGLTLPHPGLHHRDFVLLPLLEIAPTIVIPGLGRLDNHRQGVADHSAEKGQPARWPR